MKMKEISGSVDGKKSERSYDNLFSCLEEQNFEFIKDVLSSQEIRNIFNKGYGYLCIEFDTAKPESDSLDDHWYPPFSNAAHFLHFFLSRLKAKRIEERFWEQRNISSGIENSDNWYPAAINMDLKLDHGAVNLAKKRAPVALIRKSHGNHNSRMRVSFLGTKASTGLSDGCLFFASFQTEYAELPEATILSPIMAMCLPLCFSISGENLAKKSISFITVTMINQGEGNLKLYVNASISSSFLGTFMTMTSSSFIPFRLRTELTSGSESPEATMPPSVTATHLPPCLSTSSGCADIQSRACECFCIVFTNSHYRQESILKLHATASISSSFLGTFIRYSETRKESGHDFWFHILFPRKSYAGCFLGEQYTSSQVSPFFLSFDSTSSAESPNATIPCGVTATHLPLYFSTSSECDESQSSSCMVIPDDYYEKENLSLHSELHENDYSNSSLGLPVCRIMCCMTNTETSEWCGTHLVSTLPSDDFLNVMCLDDLTLEKPLDSSIFTTLFCGSGRSFATENTFRYIYWNICQRNRHYRPNIGLDSIRIPEIFINQVFHVFPDFLLGDALSSNIKGRARSDEPLPLLCDYNGKGYLNINHSNLLLSFIDGNYLTFAVSGPQFHANETFPKVSRKLIFGGDSKCK